MLDKLETIKNTYEVELEQKHLQLENHRNLAVSQMKSMKQEMR
jgi:hypothetical protein